MIPEDNLIQDLRRVANEINRPPRQQDYRDIGEYCSSTISKRLGDGSWVDALIFAGIDPEEQQLSNQQANLVVIETDDILEDIDRVCKEIGRSPTLLEYEDLGRYSRGTIRSRFETWRDAVEQAGWEPSSYQKSRSLNARLANASPEDIGLSPSGERAHGGGGD